MRWLFAFRAASAPEQRAETARVIWPLMAQAVVEHEALLGESGGTRYLRQLPSGRLRIDGQRVAAEERLDGKFLLETSDPDISAEDAALGYKNLLEAERSFRDLKGILRLRLPSRGERRTQTQFSRWGRQSHLPLPPRLPHWRLIGPFKMSESLATYIIR